MKRQRQYTEYIVGVQPGALAFTWPKGKEIFENFLVDNHAADQGYQHEKRCEPDDGICLSSGQVVQPPMHLVKQLATTGFSRLKGFAGFTVQFQTTSGRAGTGINRCPLPEYARVGLISICWQA